MIDLFNKILEKLHIDDYVEEYETDTSNQNDSVETITAANKSEEIPDETVNVDVEQIDSESIDEELDDIYNTEYVFPSYDLLDNMQKENTFDAENWKYRLEETLRIYDIKADIVGVSRFGNVVTFAILPDSRVRVGRITGGKEDFEHAFQAPVEFEVPLEGTNYIGIHVYDDSAISIGIKETIASADYMSSPARIPLVMGVSSQGKIVIEDLDEIGHMLIHGVTGSGKSVFLNDLIISMIYRSMPGELQFVFIDNTFLNLNVYNGIPFLLFPVITDNRKAMAVISWCRKELFDRMEIVISKGLRDIDDYNEAVDNNRISHIVVVIDDASQILNDDDALDSIREIGKNGKRFGVHLIISTPIPFNKRQAEVLDNLIPARVCFKVFDGKTSSSFLGMRGAENLTNVGDMLYKSPLGKGVIKIHASNVSDKDATNVADFLRKGFINQQDNKKEYKKTIVKDELDPLFAEAGRLIVENNNGSIGYLQRNLRIGFNRAALIMDQLADAGVVGPEEGTKPREIKMNVQQFERLISKL